MDQQLQDWTNQGITKNEADQEHKDLKPNHGTNTHAEGERESIAYHLSRRHQKPTWMKDYVV